MRRSRTLMMLAAAALAVGALVWIDRPRPSTDEARRARRATLDEPTGATAVAVNGLQLERVAGSWRVTQPRPARADTAAVEQLLSALGRARAASVVGGPAPSPLPDRLLLDGREQA